MVRKRSPRSENKKGGNKSHYLVFRGFNKVFEKLVRDGPGRLVSLHRHLKSRRFGIALAIKQRCQKRTEMNQIECKPKYKIRGGELEATKSAYIPT